MTKVEEKMKSAIGVRHLQMFFLCITGMIFYGMNTCMSVAVIAMTDNSNISTVRDIETFNWTSNTVSVILSSQSWGYMLGQIPFGLVTLRFSAQNVLNICILVYGLMYLLIPFLATEFGSIGVLGCTTIAGLALAPIDLCQINLMSSWVPPTERARLSAFVFSGGSTGVALSMIFSGILGGSRYGWPSIFYVFGGIAIVWAALNHFMSSNSPREHRTISAEERSYIETSLNTEFKKMKNENFKLPWKAALRSPPVWAFTLCACGDFWNMTVLFTQLPMFMKNVLDFDIEKSGGLSGMPYLTKVMLAVPIGWLSDFALKRGVSTPVVRKVANTVGMWGPSAALLSLCLFDPKSNETVTVVTFILAVGLNSANNSGYSINSIELCPNFSGTLYSFASTVAMCFGVFAPIVVGLIVSDKSNVNQWHIVFYITAGITFFANLIFIVFGKAEKQPWNEPNYSKTCKPQQVQQDNIELRNLMTT